MYDTKRCKTMFKCSAVINMLFTRVFPYNSTSPFTFLLDKLDMPCHCWNSKLSGLYNFHEGAWEALGNMFELQTWIWGFEDFVVHQNCHIAKASADAVLACNAGWHSVRGGADATLWSIVKVPWFILLVPLSLQVDGIVFLRSPGMKPWLSEPVLKRLWLVHCSSMMDILMVLTDHLTYDISCTCSQGQTLIFIGGGSCLGVFDGDAWAPEVWDHALP